MSISKSESTTGGFPPDLSVGDTNADAETSFGEIFDLLRSGIWAIIGVTLLIVALGQAIIFFSPRVYVTNGVVQIEANKPSGAGSSTPDANLNTILFGAPAETAAELQILQTRMILSQVVKQLNLQIIAEPRLFPLLGPALYRRRASRLTPAEPLFNLSKYAWGGERLKITTLEVPESLIGSALRLTATRDGYDLRDADNNTLASGHVGVMSTSLDGKVSIFVRELIARPGTEFIVGKESLQDAMSGLAPNIKVTEQGTDSGVIQIIATGSDPVLIADIVNTLQEAYLRQNVERRSLDAQQSLDFLEKQLPELKVKLDAAQAALAEFQSKNKLVDITGETNSLLQQAVALEEQRLKLQQDRLQAIQRFTPNHPAVQLIDRQIEAIEQDQGQIAKRTGTLPTTQQEIFSLTRDLQANTELYSAMLNTMQGLRVSKAGTIGNVRILDSALVPPRPTSPKPQLITLISVFLGIILGIGYVFARRIFLRGVDDPLTVEKQLSLMTYASIPYSQNQILINRSWKKLRDKRLLVIASPQDAATEALRSLRAALHFALMDAPNKIVMLTGPTPGIGKSFITANLGAVLAASRKRVLVIDADMRRGHLHNVLSVIPKPGLAEYLSAAATVVDVIHSTGIEGFDLIPVGVTPPNPAELLMHERFSDLLKMVSENYDYILVDTPPVLAVADAAIVGRHAGSSFIILKSGEHRLREIKDSTMRLQSSGVRPRGVIFNQVGAKPGSYGYGGYAYQYGYGEPAPGILARMAIKFFRQ